MRTAISRATCSPKVRCVPKDGAQRGSVMDMPVYPGDPLTPGVGATKDAKRLALSEVTTFTRFPCCPFPMATPSRCGRLTGPGCAGGVARRAAPHLPRGPRRYAPFTKIKTEFDWSTRPLYDVIATIPGGVAPDEWIIAGNHHDAWVNGADDPISGAIALMETARSLALLQKRGWKPKRTIKIALWDGEEFGLLGSTEWVEKHQDELRQKAVAYLNSG